jgi:hypothetical protein
MSIFNSKVTKIILIVIVGILLHHLLMYIAFDGRTYLTFIKEIRFENCCVKPVFYNRKYQGLIESTEIEGGTTRIFFSKVDTAYLLARTVEVDNKNIELKNLVSEGEILLKEKKDSIIYFINNSDTLQILFELDQYDAKSKILINPRIRN